MEYVTDRDLEYILNKYHDTAKPFDSFSRFIRRDELFSPESGLSPEEIMDGILKNDEKYAGLPHPVRKARALEFVLKNTRIAWDERDLFPAVNMADRPLNQTLIAAWRKEVFTEVIPEVERRRAYLEKAGIVTIWPDYDHSVPVWERLFSLGFSGILVESEAARAARACTEEEDAFFEGIRITYGAVLSFLERLCAVAPRGLCRGGAESLLTGAPQSFYEALLLSYVYFIVSEHIDGLQVRSLSGFDAAFLEFYERDLARGVSEEEIRRELAYYLLQFTAIGNYWNQPVYLGGEEADGSSSVNELSYLFLDVYDKMGLYNPKIQIKVSEHTPKEFLKKALDMVRRSRNSIVFVSDSTVRQALERTGASPEEARLCNITGCYEYSPKGAYHCSMNYLNLLKPLEYALHGGRDGVTGEAAGLPCPPPDGYGDFDALFAEYRRQLLAVIDATVKTVNGFEGYLAFVNPLSLLSATFPSCLQKAKDAIGGGSSHNASTLLFGFLADLVDSLHMIRKAVFERREYTLSALVSILDRNFEGEETLRRRLLADREKYGNNKACPDGLAVELTDFIAKNLCGRPNARDGFWTAGYHVARMSYVQGGKTAASANGRLFAQELSKNVSASMGQNREGATAAILSATKIDATAFASDAALDLGLLPSAVSGEDGLMAMLGLLLTFVKRGGHALQINVFDGKTLRDAQAHPEKYGDLQIRVCGWNVLWNNIPPKEQEAFIRQAEALT